MISKFLIDGIDALGKSTLISMIKNHSGFWQVHHYEKPELLHHYGHTFEDGDINSLSASRCKASEAYEKACYDYMFGFLSLPQNVRIICDRTHLGVPVYSGLYRGYSGNFVFDLEKEYEMSKADHARLILLTEDFSISKHFIDDGKSIDCTKREIEQAAFIAAFNKSIFPDKRIICVTAEDGSFRPSEQILEEALKT
jgi:thymidylate kinase